MHIQGVAVRVVYRGKSESWRKSLFGKEKSSIIHTSVKSSASGTKDFFSCTCFSGPDKNVRNWAIGIDTYTLLILSIKQVTNKNTLYSAGNSIDRTVVT